MSRYFTPTVVERRAARSHKVEEARVTADGRGMIRAVGKRRAAISGEVQVAGVGPRHE